MIKARSYLELFNFGESCVTLLFPVRVTCFFFATFTFKCVILFDCSAMPTANYFMFLFVLLVLGVDALDRRKCSSHCTLSDKESAGCWNTTLGFFEEVLLDQMRGYVLAQVLLF